MEPEKIRRLADGLTLARAWLGLPLMLALITDQAALAWLLLLAGGLSDWGDGVLARRAGGGSVWGARLDPLTDKILISAPLLWLGAEGTLPLLAVWLLMARELLISGWRTGQGTGGPASLSGKLKTVLQFISLLLLLWPWAGGDILHVLGWWLFWPSLVLAIRSAFAYLRSE